MKSNVTADMLQKVNEELASSNAQTILPQKSINKLLTTIPSPAPYNTHTSIPEVPEQIAKLKSALAVLSPDALRGQGKLYEPGDTSVSENYWLLVIWAIASLGWTCGKDIAREWSKQSDRYTDDGFEQAWNSFDPTNPKRIGIGSLYKLAKKLGWQSAAPVTPLPAVANRYRVMWPAEITQIQPIQWRLKNVLPATGLAAIYGQSGAGKSFLTVDLGAAISHGNPWFGIRTYHTTVIYVVLEGEAGIRNRIQALEKAQGPLPPKGFGVVTQPFEIVKPQDLADLAAVVPIGSVVFIDTLNRAAPVADENSSRDMGQILEAAKSLYRATDSLVILVHHTGKDASRGMRGHSSLFAAVDGAIEVTRDAAGNRSWTVAKAKDGEDGKTVNFKLNSHVLGQDADGEDIVSCSVGPDLSAVAAPRSPTGEQQKMALRSIKSAIASSATMGMAGAGANNACVRVDDAITAVAAGLTTTPKNKRNNRAKTLIDGLIKGSYLGTGLDASGDGWLWNV